MAPTVQKIAEIDPRSLVEQIRSIERTARDVERQLNAGTRQLRSAA